jgi:hypothetical protein
VVMKSGLRFLGLIPKRLLHRCGSPTFNTVEPIETNEWYDGVKGGKRIGVNNGLIEVELKSIETMESIWLKVNAS